MCGGDATFDECGVCDGNGIEESECDCDGNILDCLGVCGGEAIVDEWGVCNGNGLQEYWFDEDGDGLGDENALSQLFCLDELPDGWVQNNDDICPYDSDNDLDDD